MKKRTQVFYCRGERSQSFVGLIIFILVILVAAFFIKDYLVSSRNEGDTDSATRTKYYNVSEGLEKRVQGWEAQAELVIVGKFIKRASEGRMPGDDDENNGLSEIEVESVERGYYSHDRINAYIGWYAPRDQPDEYLWPYVKTKYKNNDRIRIYLNHDMLNGMYYTPGGYYTVQLLRNS